MLTMKKKKLKRIIEKEMDKEKLNNTIIDLIKKDDIVNDKYFNKNITKDSNYNNLTDEYKDKLNDRNIINDLLKDKRKK